MVPPQWSSEPDHRPWGGYWSLSARPWTIGGVPRPTEISLLRVRLLGARERLAAVRALAAAGAAIGTSRAFIGAAFQSGKALSDAAMKTGVGKEAFNAAFKSCHVVQYTHNEEVLVVYMRRTPIPEGSNA